MTVRFLYLRYYDSHLYGGIRRASDGIWWSFLEDGSGLIHMEIAYGKGSYMGR